jgi:hypothetical protein
VERGAHSIAETGMLCPKCGKSAQQKGYSEKNITFAPKENTNT